MTEPSSRLIFLYGPPAAGKLTVANALSERTGWAVFHNHVAFDLAASIMRDRPREHARLVEDIRLLVLEAAAAAHVSLIFTFVYGHPDDIPFVDKVKGIAHRAGGEVCFVQLAPESSELERRVVLPSRSAFGKVRDVESLRSIQREWDLATPIHESDLRVDNTRLSPVEAAKLIERHVRL